jgi:hypothetical protein
MAGDDVPTESDGPDGSNASDESNGPDDLPGAEGSFDAPWQARAFAVAIAMTDEGGFSWEDFQERLAAAVERGNTAAGPEADVAEVGALRDSGAIAETETTANATVEATYYEQWLAALSRLLIESDTLAAEEIAARTAEFAEGERTAEEWVEGERDHDHGDDHDRPHPHGDHHDASDH